MVSIHRPLGYGPSTLPLRHSATTSTTLIILEDKDAWCWVEDVKNTAIYMIGLELLSEETHFIDL